MQLCDHRNGSYLLSLNTQFWWFLTRASAITAWSLLIASVIWGVFLSARILKPNDSPRWLQDVHRFLGGLALSFTVVHMFSLYMDKYAHFTISNLLIPNSSKYIKSSSAALGTIPTLLGVISFYLLFVVLSTSWLMRKLPRKLWKYIHLASYVLVVAVSFHAGWSGTDTQSQAYRIFSLFLIMVLTVTVIMRILWPKSKTALSARVERRPNFGVDLLKVSVEGKKMISECVVEVTLVSKNPLPIWQPGAHINIVLSKGIQRQYSLCGSQSDPHRYVIAVSLGPDSRGGSEYIHKKMKIGDTLEISAPRNHFELLPARKYLFIAGGIGITPIKAMIESMTSNIDWKLIYTGSSLETMAYTRELQYTYPDRVVIHAVRENSGRFDFISELRIQDREIYFCGPESLLGDIRENYPREKVHFERFAKMSTSENIRNSFTVTIQESGQKISVSSSETMLDALENNNISIPASCREGICGTCEISVVSGSVEHLDSVFDDPIKEKKKIMYPCVSRSEDTVVISLIR